MPSLFETIRERWADAEFDEWTGSLIMKTPGSGFEIRAPAIPTADSFALRVASRLTEERFSVVCDSDGLSAEDVLQQISDFLESDNDCAILKAEGGAA